MNLKINHKLFMVIGGAIIILIGYFWNLLPYFIPYNVMLSLLIVAGVLPLFIPFKFKKEVLLIPWILYLIVVVANRNRELANGEFFYTLSIVIGLLFVIASVKSVSWINSTPKMFVAIGAINVLATLVFFLSNSLYETFIGRTYGEYQNGTQNGLFGYRAGIAGHYSQNATNITIVILAVWAILLCSGYFKKKKKRTGILLLAFMLLSLLSLLLTGKRAHLLFVIAVLIITYYVANPDKIVQRSFKLMMILAGAIILLSFTLEYIPELSFVFERLKDSGTDKASLLRFLMWGRALDMFSQHPIFGVGWFGFKYDSGLSELTGATAGCHNIYLQLLCETGIVGFTICMFPIVYSLYRTIKNLKIVHNKKSFLKERIALATSFAIQLFVIMYGMTGNSIFDATFFFYSVAVAINLSFTSNIRGKNLCMII